MEQWIIMLCLCAVLNGQESQLSSVKECCEAGRALALRGQDCTVGLQFSSSICSIAQQQCCQSLTREKACNKGIKTARDQGACERPFFSGSDWETYTAQICCDCCAFGLMSAKMGSSCEVSDLQLGSQCTTSAKSCCEKTHEIKPTAAVTEKPAVVTTKPPERTNNCRGSNCSQLCRKNETCPCPEGFKLRPDGVTCVDINECVARPGPCRPEQSCINTQGSYSCYSYPSSCNKGYRLSLSGTHCEDVNECLTGSHNCTAGKVCINTDGSFTCQKDTSCGTGYKLAGNNSCQDIDECVLGTHLCGDDFVCINTVGSYRCHLKEGCGEGYRRDSAGNCIDVNECLAYPGPCRSGQACINTVGSYNCHSNNVICTRGYKLNFDGSKCEDINECLTGNLCGSHSCVNLDGSYRCECRAGFAFNHISKLCEDVNECRHYPGRLCAHKCENTEGSYYCSCAAGFKLAHDERNCDDVDECESNPCSQECVNVYGSFRCYCHHGYQLSDVDGKTCRDIDECAQPNICSYYCTNTLGGFNCTCPHGYTLSGDERTCQDVDECVAGRHTCSSSESCFNTRGSFRCLSYKCPPNFRPSGAGPGLDGPGIIRCTKACQRHDTACHQNSVHLITSTVLSLPTFRNFKNPEEVVFLRTGVPANPISLSDKRHVDFKILATDDHNSFDIVTNSDKGQIVGVIRQVKPITGPKEFVLEVTMNYSQSGIVSQQNIIYVHVFISQFWF